MTLKLNASEVIKEMNMHFLNFVNLLALCMKLVLDIHDNKMTSKRKNITLIEMVNVMIFNVGLGKDFCDEALLTKCHILNGVPNKKTKAIPYEL